MSGFPHFWICVERKLKKQSTTTKNLRKRNGKKRSGRKEKKERKKGKR